MDFLKKYLMKKKKDTFMVIACKIADKFMKILMECSIIFNNFDNQSNCI